MKPKAVNFQRKKERELDIDTLRDFDQHAQNSNMKTEKPFFHSTKSLADALQIPQSRVRTAVLVGLIQGDARTVSGLPLFESSRAAELKKVLARPGILAGYRNTIGRTLCNSGGRV